MATQLQRNDLQFVQKDYDIDDGTYEIEFVLDGVEYEYEVNASTGKVLEVDRERHNANDDWGDDINDDDWNDRHHIQSNTAAQTSTSQTSPASETKTPKPPSPPLHPAIPAIGMTTIGMIGMTTIGMIGMTTIGMIGMTMIGTT